MIGEGTRWKELSDPRLPSLAEGKLLRVMVGGTAICFVRSAGVLHAVADHCPHQGKSFEAGTCEGGYIICPGSIHPKTGQLYREMSPWTMEPLLQCPRAWSWWTG